MVKKMQRLFDWIAYRVLPAAARALRSFAGRAVYATVTLAFCLGSTFFFFAVDTGALRPELDNPEGYGPECGEKRVCGQTSSRL